MSLYLYALSNPMVFVDPLGLWGWWETICEGVDALFSSAGNDEWEEMMRENQAVIEEHNRQDAEAGLITEHERRLADYETRQQIDVATGKLEGLEYDEQIAKLEAARDATIEAGLAVATGGAGNVVRRGAQATDKGIDAIRATDKATDAGKAGRGMNNPATRKAVETGRKVHDRVKAGAQAKGLQADEAIKGTRLRPDVRTRSGRPVEIKPGTPSGVRAGQRQIQLYKQATGKNGRVLYYNPNNPLGPLSLRRSSDMKDSFLKSLLDAHIAPLLLEHGFKRKKSTWNRRLDDIVHMIDFQVSKGYSPRVVESFTINVGVGVDSVSKAVHGSVPTFYKDWSCITHERIGFLRHDDNHFDKWWELRSEPDIARVVGDISHDLQRYAFTTLDQIRTIYDVRKFIMEVDSHKPKATMDPYVRLGLAVICYIVGEHEHYQHLRDNLLSGHDLRYGHALWHDRMSEVAARLEARDHDVGT